MEEKGNEVGILDTLSTWDNAGRIYRTCLFFFRWNNSWDPGTSFFPFLLAQVPQETGPCLDGWTFTMHCTGFLGFAWRADGLASKQAGGRADRTSGG